jgi:hypothetical protein
MSLAIATLKTCREPSAIPLPISSGQLPISRSDFRIHHKLPATASPQLRFSACRDEEFPARRRRGLSPQCVSATSHCRAMRGSVGRPLAFKEVERIVNASERPFRAVLKANRYGVGP